MDSIVTLEQSADGLKEEEQGPNIALKIRTFHPSYPLDNPEGDLVLLSKDDVLFRVHSIILKLASPFFHDMLGIPRSICESAVDPIPMEESADILAAILSVVYPNSILREETAIRDVELYAEELTATADKYDFPAVTAMVKRALFSVAAKVPSVTDRWSAIRRFALADRYGWTAEARLAMSWTLHYDLTSPEATAELQRVGAHSMLLLQNLHKKRLQIYKDSLTTLGNSDDLYNPRTVIYRCKCKVADSIDWSLFVHKISKELTIDPLGSRLLERETWDERGYARIFEIVHGPMCSQGPKDALLLPPKSSFITKAQAALKNLPTFI